MNHYYAVDETLTPSRFEARYSGVFRYILYYVYVSITLFMDIMCIVCVGCLPYLD